MKPTACADCGQWTLKPIEVDGEALCEMCARERKRAGVVFDAAELLAMIVGNAVLCPDPAMDGATDCYHVPADDIDAARDWLANNVTALCPATTTAWTDESGEGKYRRCELPAGHHGRHETTYCGRPYQWSARNDE